MNQFQKIFDKQKANFDSDATKSYEWRIEICFLLVEDFLELIHLSLLRTSAGRCRFSAASCFFRPL